MVSKICPTRGLTITIIYIIALALILDIQMIETQTFHGPSKCTQKKSPGECKAYIPRWYFDTKTGRCQQFKYGGCGGNTNNFKGERECQKICRNWVSLHRGILIKPKPY